MNEINFQKTVNFFGRNGYYKATGIEIFGESILHVSPITSKGLTGRCEIQIPKEDVEKLINVLKQYV